MDMDIITKTAVLGMLDECNSFLHIPFFFSFLRNYSWLWHSLIIPALLWGGVGGIPPPPLD